MFMMYSNVIIGITISRGSFVFSQSRVKVSNLQTIYITYLYNLLQLVVTVVLHFLMFELFINKSDCFVLYMCLDY